MQQTQILLRVQVRPGSKMNDWMEVIDLEGGLMTFSVACGAVAVFALAVVTVAVLTLHATIAVFLAVTVLVSAVHPPLLTLAVVAGAVGAFDDASSSTCTFTMAMAMKSGLSASGLVHEGQDKNDHSQGGEGDGRTFEGSHFFVGFDW